MLDQDVQHFVANHKEKFNYRFDSADHTVLYGSLLAVHNKKNLGLLLNERIIVLNSCELDFVVSFRKRLKNLNYCRIINSSRDT